MRRHLRNRRDARGDSSVASQIIQRYGKAPESNPHVAGPRIPRESDLRAFGPLVWLEVQRFDGKTEFWDFCKDPNHVTNADRRSMPRVAYDARNFQLWLVGGSYRVDGKGFHLVREAPCNVYPLSRVELDRAKGMRSQKQALSDYVEHHGGLEPREAVQGEIVLPSKVICVGRCIAAAYETDRNNGKGVVNWRHQMAEHLPAREREDSLPFVDVSDSGCRIFLRGGSMRVEDGWMVD